jgi:hypothetical protein
LKEIFQGQHHISFLRENPRNPKEIYLKDDARSMAAMLTAN